MSVGICSLKVRSIFLLICCWNSFQFILAVNNFGGGVFQMGFVLSVIRMAEWSELRSKLVSIALCMSEMPLVTAKSNRSGSLFGSAGQYVGSPVDNYLRLRWYMALRRFRPLGVINRDPQMVYFAFQSSAIRKCESRVRTKSLYSSADMVCLGGLYIAPFCSGHGNALM